MLLLLLMFTISQQLAAAEIPALDPQNPSLHLDHAVGRRERGTFVAARLDPEGGW